MFLTGSALSALDILDSLKSLFGSSSSSSASSGTSGQFKVDEEKAGKDKTAKADQSSGQVSSETMRALLALQAKSGGGVALTSQAFTRFDRDGSGRISKTEFDDILNGLGGTSGEKRTSLFEALDGDDDGEITETEFTSALSRRESTAEAALRTDATMQEMFQRLLRQQLEMVSTLPTGQSVQQLI
ncbi:EF-hand domain-containing protein [Rhodoplanes sp. TEM]|uniref:EF-hand domain-containing protein n=1 Tax=Rhodoplanes tepidamans TaxID=200616 RepID=A0ABT5JIP5_RHOTP|nr:MULTISPECIES: EF-hand domain-containing protein [Rhodoplanes]MDC7789231.1 EF-hand domain-containing protein [Rhodoplanes tepidamans]MDC7988161.1 EF-hand domain-containing protein [Rhodoplanes sp. TEM]MDQ0355309.1 hypothetical protein [Rhodoplanes tepidamans]